MYATITPDITVSGRGGPVLAVQVKNLPRWTSADAQAYVDSLFDGGANLGTRYVMLLSQEMAFVWRVHPEPLPGLDLLATLDVSRIFDAYRRQAGINSRLDNGDLQMLAADWLSRLIDGTALGDERPAELVALGLVDLFRDGTMSWRPS